MSRDIKIEIKIGEIFGDWTVIKECDKKEKHRSYLCKCKCGKTKKVRANSLANGRSTRCRSCSSRISGKRRMIDHYGKVLGKLKAIKPVDGNKPGENIVWEFQCECGEICHYTGRQVFSNNCSPHIACPKCEKDMSSEQRRGFLPIEMAYKNTKILTNIGYRDFAISLEEYDKLTTEKPCYYCGKNEGRCGLDRVDSSKDYSFENCVPCCIVCNRMKTNMNKNKFFEQIKMIYNNIKEI